MAKRSSVGAVGRKVIKEFFGRLVARGKSGKSAVIACMALLQRIVYGVLTYGVPFSVTPARARHAAQHLPPHRRYPIDEKGDGDRRALVSIDQRQQ
jgi:hypothetical protein